MTELSLDKIENMLGAHRDGVFRLEARENIGEIVGWLLEQVQTAQLSSLKPIPCDPDCDEPVHRWFCLTYCSYAVIPRSIAQSMPVAWQRRFARLMDQMNALCIRAGIATPDYHVHGRLDGKYVSDPYRDYQRGRRDVFREAVVKGEPKP